MQRAEKPWWAGVVLWPVMHPVWTTLVVAALCVLAGLRIAAIRPDATIDTMFPENSPASQSLLRVMHGFGAAEEMLVLASLPDSDKGTPDTGKLLAYGKRLEEAVKASPDASAMCDGISYRVDAEMRRFFEKELAPAGLFYLTDAQLEQAKQRLTPEAMRQQIAQNEVMVAAPGPAAGAIAKITLQDPLRLHEFVMDRLMGARPFQTYQNSEAFLSADGRSLLIRVRGNRPPSDIEYAKAFTRTIEQLAQKANSDGLTLDLAGSYPIATASEKAIRSDLVNSITCSVIFLQLLFLVMYRRPVRLFALAFAPVAVGVLLGFGANSLHSTTITPMTAAIGAVLAGLAIDYSVYLISDYEAHRRKGLAPRESACEALLTVTPAIFAGWLTTAIGFIAIGWSSVPGIRDFARIGVLGLTGAFTCSLILLPGLLALFDRRTTEQAATKPQMRWRTLPLLMLIARFRGWCVGGCILLLVACIAVLALSREGVLPLEQDLAVMHPHPNPPLAAQAKIAQRFGTSPDALLLHLKASAPEALVALAHDARTRLSADSVRKEGGISGTFGLADLLPDPRSVPARLEAVRKVNADQVIADFRAAIADSSFEPAAYEPYCGFLKAILTCGQAPSLAVLVNYPSLARNLLPSDSVRSKAMPTEAVMLVFVSNSLDRQQERRAAVETIRGALAELPGATLTGISVIGYDIEATVHHDLPRLIAIASAAVGLYLLIHFRSFRAAILTTLPMAAGILVLLAAARIVDYRLNLVNLIAVPMLIGVDVDYGIFLVSLAGSKQGFTRRTLAERLDSGLYAVFVCLGSALLGFGTLYFTSVPAVRSLGFAVAVGLGASLIFTLFFRLPLLFASVPEK